MQQKYTKVYAGFSQEWLDKPEGKLAAMLASSRSFPLQVLKSHWKA